MPDSEASAPPEAEATPGGMAAEGAGAGEETPQAGAVYCTDCGWENPAGANFCSKCGTKLQRGPSESEESPPEGTRPVTADLPGGAPSPSSGPSGTEDPPSTGADDADRRAEDAEQEAMGQQLTLVVGVAVLVVIGLFFVTLWSQSQTWGSDEASGASGDPAAESAEGPRPGTRMQSSGTGAPVDLQQLARQATGPVPESVQAQVDSLKAVVEQRSGEAKAQARAALANLYIGAGQNALAALAQREVARATGDPAAWEKTGQLFYAWMRRVEQQQGAPREAQAVATATASAFERVLEAQPDNLMARTRMGEAYLLTNEPMQGIQAIRRVLETDSTFVPARFQLGLALLRINRLDRAVQEFEKVKAQAESGSQYATQADRALQIISEQRRN